MITIECNSDMEYQSTSIGSPMNFGARWGKLEDARLKNAVDKYEESGTIKWDEISGEVFMGLRTREQCQSRWEKVIKPGFVKGPWTSEEDQVSEDLDICYLCKSLWFIYLILIF